MSCGNCKNGLMNWDSENSSHTPLGRGKTNCEKKNLHSYIQQNFSNSTTSETKNIGSTFHLIRNYACKRPITKSRSQTPVNAGHKTPVTKKRTNKRNVSIIRKFR